MVSAKGGKMKKCFFSFLIVVLISGCSINNRRGITTLDEGLIPKETKEVAYSALDAIRDNVEGLPDANDYKFGRVLREEQKMEEGNSVFPVILKDKDLECSIDVEKSLKLDFNKCSEKASDCIISISLPKKCKMRPLFVVDPIFSKEELEGCKVKATITGILALKKELIDTESKTQSLSFLEKLKADSVSFKVDGNSDVIHIKLSEGLDVCLEKVLQPSQYSKDIADRFLSKELLTKLKTKDQDAEGSLRNDIDSIAVFKVWFKVN